MYREPSVNPKIRIHNFNNLFLNQEPNLAVNLFPNNQQPQQQEPENNNFLFPFPIASKSKQKTIPFIENNNNYGNNNNFGNNNNNELFNFETNLISNDTMALNLKFQNQQMQEYGVNYNQNFLEMN